MNLRVTIPLFLSLCIGSCLVVHCLSSRDRTSMNMSHTTKPDLVTGIGDNTRSVTGMSRNTTANHVNWHTVTSSITEADFLEAARTGNLDLIKQAVANYDININCVDPDTDETSLHKLAKNGHKLAIKYLLQHGARVDLPDRTGKTALHWAASGDDYAFGSDSKVEPYRQSAQMHLAVEYRRMSVVEVLLVYGAGVDCPDAVGMTALHYAAWTGRDGVVGMLVAHGAEVGMADHKGWAALHYAMERGHASTVELLLAQPTDTGASSGGAGASASSRGSDAGMQ